MSTNAGTNSLLQPNGSTVYMALAAHQMSNTWELRDLLRELHRWVGIFVVEFKLDVFHIALRVDGLPPRSLGHFHSGHNGFGLEREIAINRRYLHKNQFWDALGTLLHELIHAWQKIHGQPAKSPCHHNRQFRRKAAEFGLIVDKRGRQQYQPQGAFLRLLQKHGVNVPVLPQATPLARLLGSSKLKLWMCGCEPAYRVRVARADFKATCNYCGQAFVLAAGSAAPCGPTTAPPQARQLPTTDGFALNGV
jgi:hypothetical protein